MAEETEDKPTGELTAPAPAPVVKKYVIVVDRHDENGNQVASLSYAPLNWSAKKGAILPDNVVAALEAREARGAVDNALEHWLHIGWIKEA